jgi:hypothetical protein
MFGKATVSRSKRSYLIVGSEGKYRALASISSEMSTP